MRRVPTKMAMLSLPPRPTGKVNTRIGIHPTRRFLILILTSDIFYGRAKSLLEIVCISTYKKMRNSDQLRGF
jgi:hypothetical protein